MDQQHINEFGSDRFFEKDKQVREQRLRQESLGGSATTTLQPTSAPSDSQFILPLRHVDTQLHTAPQPAVLEARVEPEKEKKGLFTKFGRKRPAKTSASVVVAEVPDPRRPSIASVASASSLPSFVDVAPKRKCIQRVDQLFLNLPAELQTQVVASLPLSDILNLRIASKGWHAMITNNETPIVRYHLEHHVPAYARRLYPVAQGGYTFHHLCGLWHRLHVAAKLSDFICGWAMKEIFLRTSAEQKAEFAPQRERMRRRLIPLLFTAFHFFETYRTLHLQYVKEHGYGVAKTPYTTHPIESKILSMYDDRTLLHLHQAFPLIISSFCRRLRPPSYVGRFERTMRGYIRDKPSDDIHVAILCLGGLRQVEKIWGTKGYNTRRGAVDVFYNSVSVAEVPKETQSKPVDAKEARPKRHILGLGRKKSAWALKEAAKTQQVDAAMHDLSLEKELPPLPSQSFDLPMRPPPLPRNSIFDTSLARGMPMDRLAHDDYSLLLADLPILQSIWHSTAEGIILERRIVERPADIKRNAAVMLDLISEDGIQEEDEWLYGRGSPESLRLGAADSIEDDD